MKFKTEKQMRFFEKMNKMDTLLTRLIKKKRDMLLILAMKEGTYLHTLQTLRYRGVSQITVYP